MSEQERCLRRDEAEIDRLQRIYTDAWFAHDRAKRALEQAQHDFSLAYGWSRQ